MPKLVYFKEMLNADDIIACIKRHQKIINIQRVQQKLSKIYHFIAKMPFNNEPYTHHLHCIVPGILSFYNFCNTESDSLLKTRIFSDQKNFLYPIEWKLESEPFDPSVREKVEEPFVHKIKNCKSIRRKRLFVTMKERNAKCSLTPQSKFYYKKSNPNLDIIPEFCKINRKAKCVDCTNPVCLYTADEINNSITGPQLKKELKDHFHPQTRKNKTLEDMKQELLEHYIFTHQNFGEENIQKKYCVCQADEAENGDLMVLCWMDEQCDEQWFHVNCMNTLNYALPKDLHDIGILCKEIFRTTIRSE